MSDRQAGRAAFEKALDEYVEDGWPWNAALRARVLALYEAATTRFCVETCDQGHDYAKFANTTNQRCPFCLSIGLDHARAELQGDATRADELSRVFALHLSNLARAIAAHCDWEKVAAPESAFRIAQAGIIRCVYQLVALASSRPPQETDQ